MRTIKKNVTMKTVEITVYDRAAKEERTTTAEISDFSEPLTLAPNCVEIERKVISEREVTLAMPPEVFVKYATVQE
jgi:hypothetical protein